MPSADLTEVDPQRPSGRLRGWKTYDSAPSRVRSLTMAALVPEILTQVLLPGVNIVVVGPLVLRPGLFVDVPEIYFMLAACDDAGFFTIVAGAEGAADAARVRQLVLTTLLMHRPALCVIAHDDELAMARCCAMLWPCTETRAILANVERERRS
jgi:hypothetical protein